MRYYLLLTILCRFRTSNHRLPIEIGRWPYEYENQTVKVHNVKGRLHKNIQFWKEKLLLAESSKNLVLPILEYGYLLIFEQESPPVILRNNKSAFEHKDFVKRVIADLVYTGVVNEIDNVPKVVSPLSVSVNSSGKERLILDLRHVNKYLKLTTFKYEGVKEAVLQQINAMHLNLS